MTLQDEKELDKLLEQHFFKLHPSSSFLIVELVAGKKNETMSTQRNDKEGGETLTTLLLEQRRNAQQKRARHTIDDTLSLLHQKVQVHCRMQLSRFKCPKRLFWVKDFPLNSSGKILKHVLLEEIVRHFCSNSCL
mmetsp:Transcript_10902/g.17539  ORF Transcript_10902/g.17539 Transcript_10902/m.17539 type:complete len:135 (-) Transcript_10902:121-525(-)